MMRAAIMQVISSGGGDCKEGAERQRESEGRNAE